MLVADVFYFKNVRTSLANLKHHGDIDGQTDTEVFRSTGALRLRLADVGNSRNALYRRNSDVGGTDVQ